MWRLYSNKPGPGVEKDEPPVKGLKLFFQVLYHEFFSLIGVNFLFYLFCIPIITIPASYCAMTRITVSMARNQPYFLWSDFWTTFRSEFRKATVAGIGCIAGLAASAIAIWYYGGLAASHPIFLLLSAFPVFGATVLIFVSYSLFPMIPIVDLPLKKIAKNALLLVPLSFFRYILASLICVALVVLGFLLLPFSLIPMLLLYPSLFSLIIAFGAYGGIKKYVLRDVTNTEEA